MVQADGATRARPRQPLLGRVPAWLWVAADAMLAGLMALGAVSAAQPIGGAALPVGLGYLLALAVTLPAAARRLSPVPVFGALLAASVLAVLAWRVLPYSGLPLAMAAYTAGARQPQRRVVAVATGVTLGVSVVVAVAVLTTRAYAASGGAQAFSTAAVVGAACVLGIAVGQRRRYAEQLREQAAEAAVTGERLRVARELHDVVAHEMSVIAVQAGVARHVVSARPDEAVRALASIEEASRAGLGELRRLVSTLRGSAGGPLPTLDPAPRLADLDALVTRAGQAGVPVTVEVRGGPRPLPPGLELSAFRIVQEALTNVVRHAGPARATVILGYAPDRLVVEVSDDGRGARPDPAGGAGGHGLVGMRERVAIYGGRLEVATLKPPATGFRVSAVLPVERGPA